MFSIHTINTQGYLMFPVLRVAGFCDSPTFYSQIKVLKEQMEKILLVKGTTYSSFKNVLIPSDNEVIDALFAFDSTLINSNAYGKVIIEKVLTLLNPNSNHCIFAGDLVPSGNRDFDNLLANEIQLLLNSTQRIYTPYREMFTIVITHLSRNHMIQIRNELKNLYSFLGFIDLTFTSMFKYHLSNSLPQLCIKMGKTVFIAHELDRSDNEDSNITSIDFEKCGYIYKSISEAYYNTFLTFKLYCDFSFDQNIRIYEDDQLFALNVITANARPIRDLRVNVDPDKVSYLLDKKYESLKRLQLQHYNANNFRQKILNSLAFGFFYNLRYPDDKDDVIKPAFSCVFEWQSPDSGNKYRVRTGFNYSCKEHAINLITLY